jgi:RNase P subunit RPR2
VGVTRVSPPRRNRVTGERRRSLGDWVAFCPSCGHVARYFEEHDELRPIVCPQCSTALVAHCPSCDARIPSAFQVECEDCGASLRPNELFGGTIRRAGR